MLSASLIIRFVKKFILKDVTKVFIKKRKIATERLAKVSKALNLPNEYKRGTFRMAKMSLEVIKNFIKLCFL